MAAVGHRDLQMLYLRRISSNASATSSIANNRRLCFKIKSCSSENHADFVRNNGDFVRNNNNNEVHKARAYGPCITTSVTEEVNSRAFNGGRSIGTAFHQQQSPEKIVVAVDVDEVLGNFVSALNQFIAEHYSLHHSISEYHVYEFFKIWNCSRDEANSRVHEFFKTPYFKTGIYPIPGAQKALQKLSKFCDLSIVTSRQNAIKDHTLEWVERYYPGFFQEIHFGNHFALDGQSKPKSDICKSLGAKVLIDDNPRYAIECADSGIKVLLFDYENSYPWCKVDYIHQHPLIIKVHNWEEVEHELASCVVP